MSNAIYLKLEGATGECQKEKHTDEIELDSFNWGIMNTATMTSKGTAEGVCTPQEVSVTKAIDSSTPAILGRCATGQPFDEAIIYVERAAKDETVTALKITLKNAFVSAYSVNDSSAGGLPSESMMMSFEEIKFEYTGQEGTSAAGTTIPFGYNIKTGVTE
jgi:type VI secretion system secreted protein Hcp